MSDFNPIGKQCDVFFVSSSALFGVRCTHSPQTTGDCWIFEDTNGDFYYVQNYERINFYD